MLYNYIILTLSAKMQAGIAQKRRHMLGPATKYTAIRIAEML